MYLPATPTEQYGPYFVKRDDLCQHPSGALGGKTRVAGALLQRISGTHRGVVLAIARNSSIPAVVAKIASQCSLSVSIHTAWAKGGLPPDFQLAEQEGACIALHRPGYHSVLNARAIEQIKAEPEKGWFGTPLGLECSEAITTLAHEAAQTTYPDGVKRLLIPVGSGMMFCGILTGLVKLYKAKLPFEVLGICVGQDPLPRINKHAPPFWPSYASLLKVKEPFTKPVKQDKLALELDPFYEAKLAKYLQPGDMLWVVAKRASLC